VELLAAIDGFILEKITVADTSIVQQGLKKMRDGDVVLTFAR
jgi:translation initiation factor 2B subunit (eIF-2B alpha/beta/delta family)